MGRGFNNTDGFNNPKSELRGSLRVGLKGPIFETGDRVKIKEDFAGHIDNALPNEYQGVVGEVFTAPTQGLVEVSLGDGRILSFPPSALTKLSSNLQTSQFKDLKV